MSRLKTEGKATSHSISFALMAVKTCSKALLVSNPRHGKSPCFSEVAFLGLMGVAARALKLACINGSEILGVCVLSWKQVMNLFKTWVFHPKKR